MAKKTWQVELEDGKHIVELEHGIFSGKRILLVDGSTIFESHKLKDLLFDTGSVHYFNINSHPCAAIVRTNGITGIYDLAVDGRSVTSGKPLDKILPLPIWVWILILIGLCIISCFLLAYIPLLIRLGSNPSAFLQNQPTPVVVSSAGLTPNFGGGGQIAFSSNQNGNWDIYRMDANGENKTRLTSSPVNEFNPTILPNGKWISFWNDDSSGETLNLRMINMDGSQERGIGGPAFSQANWSPDIKHVVFASIQNSEPVIYVLDDDGSVHEITPGSAPDWSHDGKTIAFNQKTGLFLMDPDGQNKRMLLNFGIEANWSPDGSRIAFVMENQENTNIFVVNSDGTNLRQITNLPGYNENPAWSPDGQWIAFWSNFSGNDEIYAISLDGVTLINLSNAPDSDEQTPHWGNP